MPQSWHDINDHGFFKPQSDAAKGARPLEPEAEAPQEDPKREPEVKLISAKWEQGAEGFQFNKKAGVKITAEFLKETPRRKISCGLFVVYDGQEEDLNHRVDAELEDDGTAGAQVTLYYGNGYYNALPEKPDATCQYKVKLTHPTGTAELESEPLEMPAKMTVDFIEIADIHFNHNCALPCLDADGELIALLTQVFVFAKDNPGRELIIEGHADRSGDENYNLQISKRRAEGIKALLADDVTLWEGVIGANGTDHTVETEDYQQTLKGLAANYGWPCDPGSVDNKPGPKTENAVKGFQAEYNKRFPAHEELAVDGKFGPKSWKAKFFVLRDLLEKALKSQSLDPIPALTYGYPEGQGIYPCGESCPVTGLEKSEEDRRVELVFYKKNDWAPSMPPEAGKTVPPEKDPVSKKNWKKKPVNPPPVPPPPANNGTIVSCKFSKDKVYCGDEVKITAETNGIAGGDSIQICVEKMSDKSNILFSQNSISQNKTSTDWISKKTGPAWNGPEVSAAAASSSMKLYSTVNLAFKSYGPYTKSTKTLNCASGIYGWTGKFDIEVKNRRIYVNIKIKLINRLGQKPAAGAALPPVGPAVSAADKTSMKNDIESKLSGKRRMHRHLCKRGAACDCDPSNKCCKIPVTVDVNFVESGEHHTVNLFQGNAQANATNWTRVKTRANSWAHETGHLLGWYDEYVGGAVGSAPRWKAPNNTAVMSSGLKVPKEYYWDFRDFIKNKSGEAWDIL
jgi:outer membrane protein OmpA-like peptidoglycan-associated protein